MIITGLEREWAGRACAALVLLWHARFASLIRRQYLTRPQTRHEAKPVLSRLSIRYTQQRLFVVDNT